MIYNCEIMAFEVPEAQFQIIGVWNGHICVITHETHYGYGNINLSIITYAICDSFMKLIFTMDKELDCKITQINAIIQIQRYKIKFDRLGNKHSLMWKDFKILRCLHTMLPLSALNDMNQ